MTKRFVATLTILVFLTQSRVLFFAIYGDDWLALYRYYTTFNSIGAFFELKNYTTNYDIGNILMGAISQLFGFRPFFFYLSSLILRTIAGLSYYPFVYKLTSNSRVASLSSIFFVVMFAGIETTNWVSNMNTYLSIILFNIFLYLHFVSKKLPSFLTLIGSLLLFISFLVTPTRMHGVLFLVPIISMLKIKKINLQNILNLSVSLLLYLAPILIFRIAFRNSQDIAYSMSNIKTIIENPNLVSNLFTSLGYSILPAQSLFLVSRQIYHNQIMTYLGFIFTFFVIFYFTRIRHKHPKLAKLGFLSLTSFFVFLLIPWMINPDSFFPSDHRYLIIPSSFIMLTFAAIAATLKNGLSKILVVAVLLVNIVFLQDYFYTLAKNGRLQSDVRQIYAFIDKEVELSSNSPTIFLFTGENPVYIYNTLSFGFAPHLTMLYQDKFLYQPHNAPLAVDDLKSLNSILTDTSGKELVRYGYKPQKVQLNEIYAFEVNKNSIINVTDELRDSLRTEE